MQPNLKKRAFALAGMAGALTLGGLVTSCTTTTPAVKPTPPAPAKPLKSPGAPTPVPPSADLNAPPAPREFRAAWVSTVANIDWPSKSNLSALQQQAEAIAILDRAKALNLNAIVLQVRPGADAIYASDIEPWSEYLSGAQGKAPQPWYDPLKFWVAQAHARGLELHAWFNPYRARHATAKSPVAPNHISRTSPQAVKSYGRFLWMDPAEEAASKQTLAVILDVVKRYDIDGVHIDDYFYPYPIEQGSEGALEGGGGKGELDFPDQPAWQRYIGGGGTLARADWRRQNVNQLIEALYKGIHAEKSWVRFGISPFGIGKPERRPSGIVGFSQYDRLYADAELWLENGWLDYFSPQLYWPVSQTAQAYGTLLDYWLAQNRHARHVWPGLFTSRIGASSKAFTADEIVRQIGVTRSRPNATGHVHFSMAALMDNRQGIGDQLKAGQYAGQALVPATPWLRTEPATVPGVLVRRAGAAVSLRLAAGKGTAHYAIWSRQGGTWRFAAAPASQTEWNAPADADAFVVSAVDRLGNESARVSLAAVAEAPAAKAK
ncbi:glycoside hydrolase family 10 protein [Massilia sp. TWP1-3-3]|uniref:glycoside hydrolase family 10 protein n=1 Tax=Massilia sp. TWP1-3-3 TaxID=2804573 RepID=UPI003CE982A0